MLAILQFGNETPVFVPGFQHLAACFKVGVKSRNLLPEIIQRAFKEIIGNEQVLLHIALFDAIAASRARITSLRITSLPLRSMRGSGSE